MNSDIDTKTIAKIVARVRRANGAPINEEQLSVVLGNSLRELKAQDAEKYLEVIKDLSNKLEAMATEIGRMQVQN